MTPSRGARHMGKVIKLARLKRIIAGLKKRRKKIVFTNGCFDLLHFGHIKYLEKCASLGDVLIVGLNSDASLRKIKGKGRPITGEKERAAILSALGAVDYVVIFGEPTPGKLISAITPDVLAKGGDWKKKDIVGADYVRKNGGRVVTVPFVTGYSTTRLIKLAKDA